MKALQTMLGAVLQRHLISDQLSDITEVSVSDGRITIGTRDQEGVRRDYEVQLVPVQASAPLAAPADAGGGKEQCGGCCTGKEACRS